MAKRKTVRQTVPASALMPDTGALADQPPRAHRGAAKAYPRKALGAEKSGPGCYLLHYQDERGNERRNVVRLEAQRAKAAKLEDMALHVPRLAEVAEWERWKLEQIAHYDPDGYYATE